MTASTLTLAELVNRGILAISETPVASSSLRPPAPRNHQAAPHREMTAAPRANRLKSPESKHIIASADRLVEKIRTVGQLNDDPVVLRRHILQSLQLFLTDITSKP